jgi:hypothetical protein
MSHYYKTFPKPHNISTPKYIEHTIRRVRRWAKKNGAKVVRSKVNGKVVITVTEIES